MVAPRIDPSPLRLPAGRTPSGYRGVYQTDGHRWAAKVRFGGALVRLPPAATPREAAAKLAAYYEARFGPEWAAMLYGRGPRRRLPCARVAHSPHRGGYLAMVWEWSDWTTLGDHLHPTRPRRDGPPKPWVFATQAEAEKAAARWVAGGGYERRHGLFSWLAMRPASSRAAADDTRVAPRRT